MKKIPIIIASAAAAAAVVLSLVSCGSSKLVLSTDSEEIIFDGVPMQGYTINGTRVISVEDLEQYGFEIRNGEKEINAVGGESITEVPDTSGISRTIEEISKAKPSKKTIKINSVRIDGYESEGEHYVALDKLCSFRTEYNSQWGYSDYNFATHNENGKIIVDVFRIRVIDIGAQWDRLNAMVSSPEMELYTEDYSRSSVPYYGARLEPPSGIYAGVNGDDVFESDCLGSSLNYIEFSDYQKDILKPNKDYVKAHSCIITAAWNINDLADVFDREEYIRETLDNLAKYHKPVIVRIGAEMNVSELGDAPAAYVNAFRMISSIVHEYPDFAVMWSPNDMCALNKPFDYYWPGDEYVDWIGVSAFMKKHFSGDTNVPRDGNVYFMTGDFAYTTNTLKNITDFMERHGIKKPIAVSEGGTVTQLNYPNGGEIEEWSKTRLGYMYWYAPMRFPQLKLINYFNHNMPEEVQFFNMHERPEFVSLINEALSNGQYRRTANDTPSFTFAEAADRTYEQTTIPLYTYAYLPEETIQKVEYLLDGELLFESTKIPYKYTPTTEFLPQGRHELVVRITGSSSIKEMNFSLTRHGKSVTIKNNF